MEKELQGTCALAANSHSMSSVRVDRLIRILDQGTNFNKNKASTDIVASLCNQKYLTESTRERAVKKLILKGRKVDFKSIFRLFNLYVTTNNHLITMIDILVSCGGLSLHATDEDGLNVLHNLCRKYVGSDLVARIQLITSHFGISINSLTKTGRNALYFLVRDNLGERTKWCSKRLPTENCDSLLEAVIFLVTNGIGVSCKDHEGSNPLFYLCRYCPSNEFNTILIAKTTDALVLREPGIINSIDKLGKNVLHVLCEENFHSVVLVFSVNSFRHSFIKY